MAFTLNQLQAKLNGTASEGAAPSGKKKAVSVLKSSAQTTKSVAVKSAKSVRSVMPVTTRRFEDMASEMNQRHNTTERDVWKNKLMIHMLSQYVGAKLPSDEEMDELYEQYLSDMKEVAEEQVEEAPAPKKESSRVNLSSLMDTLSGRNEVVEPVADEPEPEEEEEEEEEEVRTPKKPSGRRRLGRQAPLAQ